MIFNNVSILSVVDVEAEKVVSSESIEKEVYPYIKNFTQRENFLTSLTGIKERRMWEKDYCPSSETGTRAAILALEKANLEKEKIDLLINTSVTRDFIEPSIASLVHGNLGLRQDCMNFDISNACLGFVNAIDMASSLIEIGKINYALITNGETTQAFLENAIKFLQRDDVTEKDFKDVFANLTMGSGAVAMILTRSDLAPEGAPKVVSSVALSDTQEGHNRFCTGQVDKIITDGSNLLIHGVKLAVKTRMMGMQKYDWAKKQFDHYICHQVGEIYSKKVMEAWGLDFSKFYKTYPNFGNIGPASVIFTLSKAIIDGTIKKGERILLGGIGSGINCNLMEICF
ncbi:MAG: 3-oxoacyl-ACP synthase III [Candidatus Sericytochromatia bacterium]